MNKRLLAAHGFTQHDRERDIVAISKMAEELR